MNHTPAPWKVVIQEDGYHDPVYKLKRPFSDYISSDGDEAKANAALIAAAPELLEALKLARFWVGKLPLEAIRTDIEDLIDTVIAKADPKPVETFEHHEVLAAIESYLAFGEKTEGMAHKGYYSGSGWAARVLRYHLNRIKAEGQI